MKLNFNHRGVKLFFITFAVAGRAKALSKLVDEKSRPELSALGEAVKAALLAIHKVNEAVGVSDFIIMPDHVHFLMVVDYERDKNVSPLFLSHRVMDAIEMAIGRGLVGGKAGVTPRTPLTAEAMAELMKEAIRFYNNAERYGYEGSVIHQPKAAAKQALRVVRSPEGSAVFFNRSCYIELSFSPAQLRSIRRYIRLNPARALWKAKNPDCFVRRAIPREKLLANAEKLPPVFYAIGDLTILGSPFLFHIRLTLKKTVEEHREAIDEIVEKARHGMIPVSGFISPGEKEALRRLKAEPLARFIKTLPNALPPKYDPSAEDSRELAAHRLVILSGMAETAAISSLDIRRSQAAAHGFRQNCLLMNEIGAALCNRQ